jgi:hypothetical protein
MLEEAILKVEQAAKKIISTYTTPHIVRNEYAN